MKQKPPMVRFPLMLPENVRAQYRRVSRQMGCSVGALLREAAEKWLREQKNAKS
jgi:hypothetical protein